MAVHKDCYSAIDLTQQDGLHRRETEQSTLSNREKVIERDEEAYGKKAQPIGMYYGVRLADIVSHNAQFSATIKKQ